MIVGFKFILYLYRSLYSTTKINIASNICSLKSCCTFDKMTIYYKVRTVLSSATMALQQKRDAKDEFFRSWKILGVWVTYYVQNRIYAHIQYMDKRMISCFDLEEVYSIRQISLVNKDVLGICRYLFVCIYYSLEHELGKDLLKISELVLYDN